MGVVCKEDMCLWFKNSEPHQRLEVVCCLLNMCLPMELHFINTCLSDLNKRVDLKDLQTKMNTSQEIESLTSILDEKTRSKLIMCVALLSASNNAGSEALFQVLTSTDFQSMGILLTENFIKEILLLYTMVLNHPAFTYQQKRSIQEMLSGFKSSHGHNYDSFKDLRLKDTTEQSFVKAQTDDLGCCNTHPVLHHHHSNGGPYDANATIDSVAPHPTTADIVLDSTGPEFGGDPSSVPLHVTTDETPQHYVQFEENQIPVHHQLPPQQLTFNGVPSTVTPPHNYSLPPPPPPPQGPPQPLSPSHYHHPLPPPQLGGVVAPPAPPPSLHHQAAGQMLLEDLHHHQYYTAPPTHHHYAALPTALQQDASHQNPSSGATPGLVCHQPPSAQHSAAPDGAFEDYLIAAEDRPTDARSHPIVAPQQLMHLHNTRRKTESEDEALFNSVDGPVSTTYIYNSNLIQAMPQPAAIEYGCSSEEQQPCLFAAPHHDDAHRRPSVQSSSSPPFVSPPQSLSPSRPDSPFSSSLPHHQPQLSRVHFPPPTDQQVYSDSACHHAMADNGTSVDCDGRAGSDSSTAAATARHEKFIEAVHNNSLVYDTPSQRSSSAAVFHDASPACHSSLLLGESEVRQRQSYKEYEVRSPPVPFVSSFDASSHDNTYVDNNSSIKTCMSNNEKNNTKVDSHNYLGDGHACSSNNSSVAKNASCQIVNPDRRESTSASHNNVKECVSYVSQDWSGIPKEDVRSSTQARPIDKQHLSNGVSNDNGEARACPVTTAIPYTAAITDTIHVGNCAKGLEEDGNRPQANADHSCSASSFVSSVCGASVTVARCSSSSSIVSTTNTLTKPISTVLTMKVTPTESVDNSSTPPRSTLPPSNNNSQSNLSQSGMSRHRTNNNNNNHHHYHQQQQHPTSNHYQNKNYNSRRNQSQMHHRNFTKATPGSKQGSESGAPQVGCVPMSQSEEQHRRTSKQLSAKGYHTSVSPPKVMASHAVVKELRDKLYKQFSDCSMSQLQDMSDAVFMQLGVKPNAVGNIRRVLSELNKTRPNGLCHTISATNTELKDELAVADCPTNTSICFGDVNLNSLDDISPNTIIASSLSSSTTLPDQALQCTAQKKQPQPSKCCKRDEDEGSLTMNGHGDGTDDGGHDALTSHNQSLLPSAPAPFSNSQYEINNSQDEPLCFSVEKEAASSLQSPCSRDPLDSEVIESESFKGPECGRVSPDDVAASLPHDSNNNPTTTSPLLLTNTSRASTGHALLPYVQTTSSAAQFFPSPPSLHDASPPPPPPSSSVKASVKLPSSKTAVVLSPTDAVQQQQQLPTRHNNSTPPGLPNVMSTKVCGAPPSTSTGAVLPAVLQCSSTPSSSPYLQQIMPQYYHLPPHHHHSSRAGAPVYFSPPLLPQQQQHIHHHSMYHHGVPIHRHASSYSSVSGGGGGSSSSSTCSTDRRPSTSLQHNSSHRQATTGVAGGNNFNATSRSNPHVGGGGEASSSRGGGGGSKGGGGEGPAPSTDSSSSPESSQYSSPPQTPSPDQENKTAAPGKRAPDSDGWERSSTVGGRSGGSRGSGEESTPPLPPPHGAPLLIPPSHRPPRYLYPQFGLFPYSTHSGPPHHPMLRYGVPPHSRFTSSQIPPPHHHQPLPPHHHQLQQHPLLHPDKRDSSPPSNIAPPPELHVDQSSSTVVVSSSSPAPPPHVLPPSHMLFNAAMIAQLQGLHSITGAGGYPSTLPPPPYHHPGYHHSSPSSTTAPSLHHHANNLSSPPHADVFFSYSSQQPPPPVPPPSSSSSSLPPPSHHHPYHHHQPPSFPPPPHPSLLPGPSYPSAGGVVGKKPLSCFNCGQLGHRGTECKEASIEEMTKRTKPSS